MTLKIRDSAKSITLYARNMLKVRGKTFLVHVQEEVSTFNFIANIYTVLSTMFTLTLCCLCVVGCCKCFIGRDQINYDVDEVNPNWDQD